MTVRMISFVAAIVAALAGSVVATRPTYPHARIAGTVDTFHGVAVADPFRWLEEVGSEETTRWLRGQEELLRSYVAGVPIREKSRRRILELNGSGLFLTPVEAGGRYFFMRIDSSGVSHELWIRDTVTATPRRVLEVRRRAHGDEVLTSFSPSPNGRLVAYTVSEGQSAWLTVRVLDVAGRGGSRTIALEAHAMSSTITWARDGSGFFHTHYDRGADKGGPPVHTAIRRYDLASRRDATIYSPAIPGVLVTKTLSDDGRYLVIAEREGSRNENRVLYVDLAKPAPRVRELIPVADATYTFMGSRGTTFWFFTDRDAPRGRVIAVELDRPRSAHWRVVVPERSESVAANSAVGGNALGMYGDRFVLTYLRDGRPVLRVFGLDGRLEYEPELPAGGTIWGGFSGRQGDPEVFFRFLGLTQMGTVYRLDLAKKECRILERPRIPLSSGDFEIEHVSFESRDGTPIPMFVVTRRGLPRDRRNPAYLYGYGAFGWVSFPWYQPFVIDWLERGGVYALPALRGGGEYGEPWHAAGAGRNKATAIADYIAAAEWLVRAGYTSAARLVANGGSASGGIVAAAVLARPELFGAAVIDRPLLDMVRFDRFTQAAYWLPEFGSPANESDFRSLLAWSPYHNVRRGSCYPPTMVMTGDHDQVAVPLHAYKFTAAMQAAQSCDRPVLLEVIRGAGHNFGTTPEQVADSFADESAFLERALTGTAPFSTRSR